MTDYDRWHAKPPLSLQTKPSLDFLCTILVIQPDKDGWMACSGEWTKERKKERRRKIEHFWNEGWIERIASLHHFFRRRFHILFHLKDIIFLLRVLPMLPLFLSWFGPSWSVSVSKRCQWNVEWRLLMRMVPIMLMMRLMMVMMMTMMMMMMMISCVESTKTCCTCQGHANGYQGAHTDFQ